MSVQYLNKSFSVGGHSRAYSDHYDQVFRRSPPIPFTRLTAAKEMGNAEAEEVEARAPEAVEGGVPPVQAPQAQRGRRAEAAGSQGTDRGAGATAGQDELRGASSPEPDRAMMGS